MDGGGGGRRGTCRLVRLKSCHGKYLTATETPFLLGMLAKTMMVMESEGGGKNEWEPIWDGFQVKLRSWCGKHLRGNRGTPPWRNTVTHDDPYGSAAKDWVLWDVKALEDEVNNTLQVMDEFSESALSSFASDDISTSFDPSLPMSDANHQ